MWIATFVVIESLVFNQIRSITRNPTITKNVLVLLKVFLEQDNPFPKSLIDNPRSKYIIGTLLLTGIVLSNAYKNTNVHKMIVQRKPVAYRYLEELLKDNFTIHSRSLQIGGDIFEIIWWLLGYKQIQLQYP